MRQFDPNGEHKSVELGGEYWFTGTDYHDLNDPMCQVVGEYIEQYTSQKLKEAKTRDILLAKGLLAKHGISMSAREEFDAKLTEEQMYMVKKGVESGLGFCWYDIMKTAVEEAIKEKKLEEYLLMQETPGGKKTILAAYTPENKAIGQETADKFKSIKDGCRYYLKKRAI